MNWVFPDVVCVTEYTETTIRERGLNSTFPFFSLLLNMTNEERAKYFLLDVFKNSRFTQAVEENKNLVIDCYQLLTSDNLFMLELRDIIASSGEDYDYANPVINLMLGGIINHANLGSVLKLREFGNLEYSNENLTALINYLKHETKSDIVDFTKRVIEETARFDEVINFKSSYELDLYEALYEENTKLLAKLEKVKNKEDYDRVIQIIRWEEKK